MIFRDKTRTVYRTVLYLALLLPGCATLPEYAAPTIAVVDDIDMDLSDVIPYRELTRDDFRGLRPPRQFDARMAAVTCVYTQPVVDREAIEIQPETTAGSVQAYVVTYGNLSYRALMNRSCSWWNSAVDSFEEAYVLEHEQIHFALFEIAARKWSAGPPVKIQLEADEREVMLENLQARFEEILQQRLAVLLAQNRKFDEETSVGHNPEKQQRWLEMVQQQLAATAGHTAALPGDTASPSTRPDKRQ